MAAMASLYKIFIAHGGHLEILQTTPSPEPKVGLSWNLKGGIGATWRFRIAKIVLFQYPKLAIMVAILKYFKRHLFPKVRLSWNLMTGIGLTWQFLIVKIVPFWYPRWPPWHPSIKSSIYICSRTVSPIEQIFLWRHWGVKEIPNC